MFIAFGRLLSYICIFNFIGIGCDIWQRESVSHSKNASICKWVFQSPRFAQHFGNLFLSITMISHEMIFENVGLE